MGSFILSEEWMVELGRGKEGGLREGEGVGTGLGMKNEKDYSKNNFSKKKSFVFRSDIGVLL